MITSPAPSLCSTPALEMVPPVPDHVVNQDTGVPGHVADDAVGHHLAGYPRITGLVDEGEGNTT